ncbi:sensor histidine kinase [Paenibacillus chartarius]|uniref:histidine kinase n=1 Tax=Paenibacillus chartarius TaxID=747481 RepID=A0ABV6DG26_9BACL
MRNRAPLLLLLWLLIPLAVLCLYAYSEFCSVTIRYEKEQLLSQADQLSAWVQRGGAEHPEETEVWRALLRPGSSVRWIDAEGAVRIELATEPRLGTLRPPSYRILRQPSVVELEPDRLYVMAPIFSGNSQTGVIELGRTLEQLRRRQRRHLTGLLTLAGVTLAVTGAAAAVYGNLRRNSTLERQRRYWADLFHELRTPLTVIESYAGMMKRWASNDPKVREEALDVIVSESSRLRRLASRLLEAADDRAHAAPLQLSTIDLAEQLRSTCRRLSTSYRRTIVTDELPGALPITGDAEELEQLWIILLDNAIKYSDREIDVAAAIHESHASVTVRDRGIGIPGRELPMLFDRHYRGAGVRKRKSGAGLGLSIAYDIVRRHGGTIDIDSKPGAGTAVTVSLPMR